MLTASNRLALLGVGSKFLKWNGLGENTQKLVSEKLSSTFTYNKCDRFSEHGLVIEGELPSENSKKGTAKAYKTTSLGESAKIACLYHNKYLVEHDILELDLAIGRASDGNSSTNILGPKVLLHLDDVDSLNISSDRLSIVTQHLHPTFIFRNNSLVDGNKAYKVVGSCKAKGKRNSFIRSSLVFRLAFVCRLRF